MELLVGKDDRMQKLLVHLLITIDENINISQLTLFIFISVADLNKGIDDIVLF